MAKTIDFDNYMEEKKEENITIKAFGEEFELPPQIPLKTMENIIQLRKELGKDGAIPEAQIFTALEQMIGKEALEVLKENDANIEDAQWLLKQIWKMYRTQDEKDAEEGNSGN